MLPCHIGCASLAGFVVMLRAAERLQVEEPQVGRPAAAIALPVAEVLRHRHVDELRCRPARRRRTRRRDRQLLGQPAVEADEVELAVALAAALASRGEQHPRAVRVPADDAIGHRMMRQAHGSPPLLGDDVDVDVAVVGGAVGDLRPVGRKARERLLAWRRGQAKRRSPFLADQPDVAGIDERDLRLRDRGIAEHPRIDLRGRRRGGEKNEEQTKEQKDWPADHGNSRKTGTLIVMRRQAESAATVTKRVTKTRIRNVREDIVRGGGLVVTVFYALAIVWIYARQPETFAEVSGGLASAIGAYRIDEQSFADGLDVLSKGSVRRPLEPLSHAPTRPNAMRGRSFTLPTATTAKDGTGMYSDDQLYGEGLKVIDKAIALAPDGRLVVDDLELLDAQRRRIAGRSSTAGLKRDASDLNPLRVFGTRK